jgi:tetratricopeptide (TPR) repeat protein
MKKNLFLTLLQTLFLFSSNGQSGGFDKNKVVEYFQNQQFEEAIDYLLPAAVADSQNISLLGYLAYANYMNDNTAAAEKYYQDIFSIDSLNIPAIQYLAILNKNDNPGEALQYTRRLVSLQPGKAAHYRSMGELFKRKEKKDSAFVYYSKAYQLSPKDYRNGTALADILIDDRLYARADSIIEAGLVQDSVNVSFLKLRIRSAYNADDYENVRLPGERLIRLDESPLTALTQVVIAYYNLKLYTDCIRVCEYLAFKGYAIDNILFYEAKAWARLKDFNKSNELLKICVNLSISKDAEMYYYNLALNYESLKQYKKAVGNYDTAYYLFKNPVMNYNSGRICEINLKNMQLARKYYTAYLTKANPAEADEKKAYEYVKERWGKKNTGTPKNK